MDFDAVADELYSGPPEDFVTTRNQRVAEARKSGDKELAKRIGALRKPSLAAWLVNRLAHEHPGELTELIGLGDELRAAHADLDGRRLRELSGRKQAAVQRVADRVRAIGANPSQAVMDQVVETLEAAVASPEAAAQVTAGRLAAAIAPAGFDQWMIASAGSSAATNQKVEAKSTGKDDGKQEPDDARQRQVAEARDRLATARKEQSSAETALAKAKDAATEAEQQVEDLKAQLAEAERDLRKRRDAARQAQQDYDAAMRAVKDAEKALQRLNPS